MNIYIHKNDEQFGPFNDDQLSDGIKTGQFTLDDLAWIEGQAEWVPLRNLWQQPQVIPQEINLDFLPNRTADSINIPEEKQRFIIQTNVKQGAFIGGCVCFGLGLVSMYFSMWTFFVYGPLFLAAFVLSIVAMAQKRVAGGVALLLATIILPSLLGLFLFTTRTTEAVAKALGVENKPVNSVGNEFSKPTKIQTAKNDVLDKRNGFRNITLGTQYAEWSDLIEIDNGFFHQVFKSNDDESKQYTLKEKGENIGTAEINRIDLTFNQNILTKVCVNVSGKQNVLILKESLLKAYGEPFTESKKISSWIGEKTCLELITNENPDWATAEYTNKEIDNRVKDIINNNKILKQEEMKKKAKEGAEQGSKSL